jgi:two-component sensor histidine kinase
MIYWIAGVLWILLSDRVLLLLFPDPSTVNAVQTYKGWFFVSITALLLYITLKGQLLRWEYEARARRKAQEELVAANREKDLMLKEIHHRVKNNLQVMSSLAQLQMQDAVDERQRILLRDIQHRIRAMAIVHEKLYHSGNFAAIDFGELLRTLSKELSVAYGEHLVEVEIDSQSISIGIDDAIPLGLILNELLTNAFKHAFPEGRKGKIAVTFRRTDSNNLELVVRDDGIGIPPEQSHRKHASVGMTLVNALIDQIEGTVDIRSNSGTAVTINFAG